MLDKKIEWFKRNLDLQVEDLKFEAHHKKVVLYFDTSVVQGAVLGFADYYKDMGIAPAFGRKQFASNRALVQCLISSNWLGKVRMLPAHQAEFIGKLDSGFDTGGEKEWANRAHQFLKDANIKGADELKLELELTETRKEELNEVLQRHAEFAPQWFKAIQSLLPWHRRLGMWVRHEILDLPKPVSTVPDILISPFFRLENALNHTIGRESFTRNNFIDAAAHTTLIQVISEFNSGDSIEVPRLYVPSDSDFILKAISSAELDSQFQCLTVDNERSTVFRDDYYFVFKVALRRPVAMEAANEHQRSQDDAELSSLHQEVTYALRQADGQATEALERIKFRGKPLPELISELQNLAFLKNDWLQIKAQVELWNVLKEMEDSRNMLEDIREVYESELVQKTVSHAIKEIREELTENVNAYNWASSLWTPLKAHVDKLKKRVPVHDDGNQDYFRDLGLLRYGFPNAGKSNLHKAIIQILNDLCSGDEDRTMKGCTQVVRAYLEGRARPKQKSNELIIASAILLATRMNHELFKLLDENRQDLPHFSLRIAHIEMLMRLCRQDRLEAVCHKTEVLLRQLDSSYSDMRTNRDRADLAVGLAYVYYHAWRLHGLDAIWRRSDLQELAPKWQRLIDNAIVYADRAYKMLSVENLTKKVYALNQYLFFLTEGAGTDRLRDMERAKEILVGYKDNKEVWQFRFDDTLARHFHRQAARAKSEAEWTERMEYALNHIQMALKNSDDDHEIKHYYSVLTTSKAAGFQAL
ncbi:MAG TPA: hypothetical protein VNO50_11915 [Pyrinomonadaceae bacterium]|nr:hypothetical protein [Pyrinomonadaceae bacterium]